MEERWDMSRTLYVLRLSLSGAIIGAAIAGLTAGALGIVASAVSMDVIGALLGGGIAAAAVKLAHVV
jgi:hypothetical protein